MLTRVEKMIRQIAANHQSGAAVLTRKAMDCFVVFAENTKNSTPDNLRKDLHEMAKKLVQAQPEMAPLQTLTHEILFAVNQRIEQGCSVAEGCHLIKEQVAIFCQRLDDADKKIAAAGLELIQEGETILTHSYSSSVKKLIQSLCRTGRSIQVVVTESCPGYEGRQLAKELDSQGIHTTLIVDTAALKFLKGVQHVIVGADRITETYFVNKIGTLALLLGAQHAKKEVFIVSDTTKFIKAKEFLVESKFHHLSEEEEVWKEHYPNVFIENPCFGFEFEKIPLSLVSGILCDRGLITPDQVLEKNP